jgi:chaperone modulatory protein CbpM
MNALVPARWLRAEVVAERCGLHPDLVRRLTALGLLEPVAQAGEDVWFAPSAVARVARIERLHRELSLNYAAVGIVLDLLERVERLEAELRRAGLQKGAPAHEARSLGRRAPRVTTSRRSNTSGT